MPTILTFPLEFLSWGFQGRARHEFLVTVLASRPWGKYININYEIGDVTNTSRIKVEIKLKVDTSTLLRSGVKHWREDGFKQSKRGKRPLKAE